MDLRTLVVASHSKLLDDLASTVEELCAVIDEISYVRAQELEAASLAWNGDPSDSIQKKDRAAKYAAAAITTELYKLEATRDALIERKFFVIRLLDDQRTRII